MKATAKIIEKIPATKENPFASFKILYKDHLFWINAESELIENQTEDSFQFETSNAAYTNRVTAENHSYRKLSAKIDLDCTNPA